MNLEEFKEALKKKHVIDVDHLPNGLIEWLYSNGNTYYLDEMNVTQVLLVIKAFKDAYEAGKRLKHYN